MILIQLSDSILFKKSRGSTPLISIAGRSRFLVLSLVEIRGDPGIVSPSPYPRNKFVSYCQQ